MSDDHGDSVRRAYRSANKRLAAENVRLAAQVERLRRALSALYDYERQRHPPRMGGDEYLPYLAPLMAAADDALRHTRKTVGR